jgi:hypothetical protein
MPCASAASTLFWVIKNTKVMYCVFLKLLISCNRRLPSLAKLLPLLKVLPTLPPLLPTRKPKPRCVPESRSTSLGNSMTLCSGYTATSITSISSPRKGLRHYSAAAFLTHHRSVLSTRSTVLMDGEDNGSFDLRTTSTNHLSSLLQMR